MLLRCIYFWKEKEMPFADKIELEDSPCPMGCSVPDTQTLIGGDRLHGLPGEFAVVRCQACGLMRTNPRPTVQAISLYYPEDYSPHGGTHFPNGRASDGLWKLTAKRIFNTDSRKIPPLRPGRMLEIGCASGAFLGRMAARGWQVEGLEQPSRVAEDARRQGYLVQTGELEHVQTPTEPFDLVVGWQVLEHLHNPVLTLEKLHDWTKPGGWLALSVPDASAWEFSAFGARWYGLDLPRHLFHFTPRTLRAVLAKTGWKTERIFWHRNPNNLLHSLRYCCLDRGWVNGAGYLLDVVQGRRQRVLRSVMGLFVGTLRASGRMTAWATRV
jgi:2-polyprenyl-3-methyl-5-hydroxy-6-metoxy-1,4-benzoquinol methylase